MKGGYTTVPSLSDLLCPQTNNGNHNENQKTTSSSESIQNLLQTILTEHNAQWSNLILISADLPPHETTSLATYCWNGLLPSPPLPLIIVRTYGLLGTVRVQIRRRPIVETKPENVVPDLRLSYPFPALRALVDRAVLNDAMDDTEHGRVPFVVLLVKALDSWRSALPPPPTDANADADTSLPDPDQRVPRTSKEKNSFRDSVRTMARNFDQQLNFQEAHSLSYLAYASPLLTDETNRALAEATTQHLQQKVDSGAAVTPFDRLLHALGKFCQPNHENPRGEPPLDGTIPDMTSSTVRFVEIQTVYRDKAKQDRDRMRTILDADPVACSSTSASASVVVTDEQLATFCHNVRSLNYVETRPYSNEHAMCYSTVAIRDNVREEVMAAVYDPYETDPEQSPLLWYIALRACLRFREVHGVYPGKDGRKMALEADARVVQGFIEEGLLGLGLVKGKGGDGDGDGSGGASTEEEQEEQEHELIRTTLRAVDESGSCKHAQEVVRYHAAELHNVASVVGGVASQEAVKVVTGQYVPLEGTYLYNGIAGVCGGFRF